MIIHVDMDAFFASVEVREQPWLTDKPIIVGAAASRRGVVAAANYEARKFGIHSAMPTITAQRKCPHLIVLPVQMGLYSEVSQQIRDIFARYTPLIEPLSLDEAFLDVTSSQRLFESAETIARRIKKDIHQELALVASVGLAPNKFIAKLASDAEKPNGFVVVAPQQVQRFLDPIPVQRLCGVGDTTAKILGYLGIHTLAQLRQQQPEVLQRNLGKLGEHLLQLAQGVDERPVVTEKQAKSISHETTFAMDISDKCPLLACLLHLTEQVAWRLRKQNLRGNTLLIKVRFADFTTITRARTLNRPSHSTDKIWQLAADLFDKVMIDAALPVRLLGIGISKFDTSIQVQQDLFEEDKDKRSIIDAVTDKINFRFGRNALQRGRTINAPDPRQLM